MKKRIFLLSVMGCWTAAGADSEKDATGQIQMKDDPEDPVDKLQIFSWSGKIKDQTVELHITAGKFNAAKHTLTEEGSWVDGYPSQDGIGANNSFTHIRECNVIWNGKKLKLAQNVFTSVFSPMLRTLGDPTELTGEVPARVVTIRPSDAGNSILLIIPIGGGEQSMLIVFTITRLGEVYRSTLTHIL